MSSQVDHVEDIINTIWGIEYRNGKAYIRSSNFIDRLLFHPCSDGLAFNSEYTIRNLQKAGFTASQIQQLREFTVQSWQAATAAMVRKYNVDPNYISKHATSFGVYQLFLNVPDSIREEANDVARKLVAMKIRKHRITTN